MTGEVKGPMPWDQATTSKVDPPKTAVPAPIPDGNNEDTPRYTKMTEAEFDARIGEGIRRHAVACMQCGGQLYQLAKLVELQSETMQVLRDQTKSAGRRSWAEVLATPAAIVFATLMVLLYLRLHGH